MKTLLLLSFLFLITTSCAKETQAPGQIAVPAQSKYIKINASTCAELKNLPHENYVISSDSDKKYFILTNDILYNWNLATGQTSDAADGETILAGVCKLTVAAGRLTNVELIQLAPARPACGGTFQPRCIPQVPVNPCIAIPQLCG